MSRHGPGIINALSAGLQNVQEGRDLDTFIDEAATAFEGIGTPEAVQMGNLIRLDPARAMQMLGGSGGFGGTFQRLQKQASERTARSAQAAFVQEGAAGAASGGVPGLTPSAITPQSTADLIRAGGDPAKAFNTIADIQAANAPPPDPTEDFFGRVADSGLDIDNTTDASREQAASHFRQTGDFPGAFRKLQTRSEVRRRATSKAILNALPQNDPVVNAIRSVGRSNPSLDVAQALNTVVAFRNSGTATAVTIDNLFKDHGVDPKQHTPESNDAVFQKFRTDGTFDTSLLVRALPKTTIPGGYVAITDPNTPSGQRLVPITGSPAEVRALMDGLIVKLERDGQLDATDWALLDAISKTTIQGKISRSINFSGAEGFEAVGQGPGTIPTALKGKRGPPTEAAEEDAMQWFQETSGRIPTRQELDSTLEQFGWKVK